MLRHASALHDVGKIGIPDNVLLKPGALDADEWKIMQSHTAKGAEILAGLEFAADPDGRGDRPHPPRALGRHRLSRVA